MQHNHGDILRILKGHARTGLASLQGLSILQRIYSVLFTLILTAFTVLFILFHTKIFNLIESWKTDLVDSTWKWIILVGITAATSFPPLIGYASSVTLAGYVFGFWRGWGIAILGSVSGAGLTFLIYRRFLANYAARMSAHNHNFMALTKALDGSEGLTLLIMIRFCPFPFSLSNAALSTIPSITFARFMFATLLATFRLTVHAFVGSRLASLAEDPNTNRNSKIVNWISIVVGILLGIITGFFVYKRTKLIAERLASERAEEQGQSQESTRFLDHEDDFSEEED